MGVDVKPGQVWKDWDTRYRSYDPGRQIEVIEVTDTHAVCRVITAMGAAHTGKMTQIKLSRMKPTSSGYKLVKDVQTNPQKGARVADEQEVDGGTKIILPTGEKIAITARFTTAANYVQDIINGEKRFFVKADGSGRLFLAPDTAKAVVLEEVKG